MRVGIQKTLAKVWEKSGLWLQVAVLLLAGAMPALTNQQVSAAQLTSRKVTLNKSAPDATDVEHIFQFDIPNTTAKKAGIMYQFCTTPLGTCTLPTGMVVNAATHDGQTGWPEFGTDPFVAVSTAANVGDCTTNTNAYIRCFSRDDTAMLPGATGGGTVTHTISNITAPDDPQSVYVRISIYSDDDFGSGDLLDQGIVAEAFVRQLTVSGRVQERLEFCVAAVDDTYSIPTSTTCASLVTTTDIALGVIDNGSIVRAPVDTTATNLANDRYGLAVVNTNASAGVVVAYYPEPATNVTSSDADQLYAFRVLPTDCNASPAATNDQCFDSASGSGETISVGVEKFGMSIPCIDANDGTRSTTANLGSVPAAYDSDGDFSSSADCENTDAGTKYAWNESSTAATIASSGTVVDDEAIKLRFGATASPTTPNGSYTVTTTYIATATF